ncbi:uncharacterized protein LOC124498950 [Dermatophagoides farinae]|uniref:uncharacterized protein LOC124498950 n=1 Tax=Dermatophagoides farinae TaxID=6954 RepID=UPI003F643B14
MPKVSSNLIHSISIIWYLLPMIWGQNSTHPFDDRTFIQNFSLASKIFESKYEFNESMNVDKSENFYDIPNQPEWLHDTFLLLSSVNSIRFWSLDCPIHHSSPLLVNSTRHAYRTQYGISGMSIYQPTSSEHFQLFWFDVPSYQLYHGTIIRPNNLDKKDCGMLLRLENIKPIQLDSNPLLDDPKDDNFFHLTIDAQNELLFLSNLLRHRIDIYQITNESLINNEIQWLESFNQTNHPKNVQVDQEQKILFWIESWKRICSVNYSDMRNLNKICTKDFYKHKPVAMTLDLENHRIIWSDKSSNILSGDYWIESENEAHLIYKSSISSVMELTVFSNQDINGHHKQWIFVQDQHEVQLIDLSTNNETIVLIESQTIFESLLLAFRRKHDQIVVKTTKFPAFKQDDSEKQISSTQVDDKWFYFFIIVFVILSILIVISVFTFLTINNNSDEDDSLESGSVNNPGYRKLTTPSDQIFDTGIQQHSASLHSEYQHDDNNKQSKIKSRLVSNDIEDIVPIISSESQQKTCLSFTNPFILANTCDSCLLPEHCQGQGICLATYSRNKQKNNCK